MIEPQQKKPRQKKTVRAWLALIAKGLTLTILTVIGVTLAGAYIYWSRSLPDLSGEAQLAGLTAKTEIFRDDHGIPHIFAASREDAMRALGYVHASDRFFSMEMNRRAGQGRLSEAIGKSMLPTDRFLRTLDLYRLAESSFANLPPPTQNLFHAYAEGVNAWLETHRDRLPLEFQMLGIKPEPWRPADSVVWGKLMALRLSANMRAELRRASLASASSAETVERLYPAYPANAPITVNPKFMPLAPPPGTDAVPEPDDAAPGAPLQTPMPKSEKDGALDPALGKAYDLLAESWPVQGRGASNEWVVSGARSATGKPLLANDPHLELEAPILWYLASITAPDMVLTGATVPGLPGVLLGQNGHIAWGFTTTNSDVQDMFVETVDPDDAESYLTPDGGKKFSVRAETIKVKGEPDAVMTVRATRHGPVISDADESAAAILKDKNQVIAFAFTALEENDTTPEALQRMNMARNWDDFQNALKLFQAPPQNIVYADRDGHIGFTAAGKVPVRKEGNGRYPVPGAEGKYDWRGMVPFASAPQLYDPAGGTIFNGNNAVVGRNSYWFGREWETPYRAARIEQMLHAKDKFTAEDFASMQRDVTSLAAAALMRFFLKLQPETPLEREALERLRGWDFTMDADKPEPLIFEWWAMRLHDVMVRPAFGDKGGKMGPYNAQVLAGILGNSDGWCERLPSEKSRDCMAQVKDAFQRTLKELTERHGGSIDRWRWGDEHAAPLENKVLRHLPGFDRIFGFDLRSGGGQYTVNRGGNDGDEGEAHPFAKTHGAGFRAIYDLADPGNSRFMIATGQSGHPLSSFYGDLAPLWNSGQYVTIGGTREQLAASNRGRLILLP
ncbi:MAG: penicillin acylase family protein [Alphaproteobacteria bacterium]